MLYEWRSISLSKKNALKKHYNHSKAGVQSLKEGTALTLLDVPAEVHGRAINWRDIRSVTQKILVWALLFFLSLLDLCRDTLSCFLPFRSSSRIPMFPLVERPFFLYQQNSSPVEAAKHSEVI